MNDPVALATLATVVLMGLDKLSNKFSFNLCSGLGLKTCAMKCSQCCEIDMNMRSGNYSRAFRNTTLNNPILPIIQKTLDPVPIESSIQQHTAPLDLKDIILLNNQTAGEKPILLSHLSNPSNHSNRSNRSNHTQVDTHIPDRSLPSRQSSFASQPDEIDWHSFDPSKKKNRKHSSFENGEVNWHNKDVDSHANTSNASSHGERFAPLHTIHSTSVSSESDNLNNIALYDPHLNYQQCPLHTQYRAQHSPRSEKSHSPSRGSNREVLSCDNSPVRKKHITRESIRRKSLPNIQLNQNNKDSKKRV